MDAASLKTFPSSKHELSCKICSQPLVTLAENLSEELVALIASYAEEGHCKKNNTNNNNYVESPEISMLSEIADEQPVATKCGHIFHMGCLRIHITDAVSRCTPTVCPICKKPMLKTRLWPVLVSPTPNQAEKIRNMKAAKAKNAELVTRLTAMRTRIMELEKEIMENSQKTAEYILDIKGSETINCPTNEEIEDCRKTYEDRRQCIKKITDHSSALVDVLANELRRGGQNKGLALPAPHNSISEFIESKRKLIYAIKQTEMNGGVQNLEWDSNVSVGPFNVLPEQNSTESPSPKNKKVEKQKQNKNRKDPNNSYESEEQFQKNESNKKYGKNRGVIFCPTNSECSSYTAK